MKKIICIFVSTVFITACSSMPPGRSVEISMCCYNDRLIRVHMARDFGGLRRIFINTYNFSEANVHTWSWNPRRFVCPSIINLANSYEGMMFFSFVHSTDNPRAIAGRAYNVYRLNDGSWFFTSRIQVRR